MTSLIFRVSVFCLALVACNGTWLASAGAQSKEPTTHQKIYFLQHKLIPMWTYQTNGAFFRDLSGGDSRKLLEVAAKLVSPEFSAGISVKPYPELNAVLISFPAPGQPPECYFIYIHGDPASNSFALFTYEMTRDLFNQGHKGVVGSWSTEGSHGNLGFRAYEDSESFVREMQKGGR